MKCYWDKNKDAIGICKSCGRAICEACIGDDSSFLICYQCHNNVIIVQEKSDMTGGPKEPLIYRIVPTKMDDEEKNICLVCNEPLESRETQYCKKCRDLIKYGL